MKTFDELTGNQKDEAIGLAFSDIVELVRDGVVELALVDPISQKRLDLILSEARKTDSQRLIILRLLNDKPIRTEIARLALVVAHGAEYNDDGEIIMEVERETVKRFVG